MCRLVDQVAKVFIAGVPALALIAAAPWAVTLNLPALDQQPVMAFGLRTFAILVTAPAAFWLYKTIANLKERGLA
jgi:hypothetical protein